MEEMLVLASASPRRKQILQDADMRFCVVLPDEGEMLDANLPPPKAVEEVALWKAENVKGKLKEKKVCILAADTIVVLQNEILQKPKDEEDAFRMLTSLSGRVHEVYTGYCILCEERKIKGNILTRVLFKELSSKQIKDYIRTGEPLDKAGAYGIQGGGGNFVESFEGDFDNVVGLPKKEILKRLEEAGWKNGMKQK